MKFAKGKVGRNAYKVSAMWKLGLHYFKNGGDKILRLCYFRGKATHYVQVYFKCQDVEVTENDNAL